MIQRNAESRILNPPLTVHTHYMRQSLESLFGTSDIRLAYRKATAMDDNEEQEDGDFLPPASDNQPDVQDSAADGESVSDFASEGVPQQMVISPYQARVPNVQLSVHASIPFGAEGAVLHAQPHSPPGPLAYSHALNVYERYRPFEDAEALARLETSRRRRAGVRVWTHLASTPFGCAESDQAMLFVSRGTAGVPLFTPGQLRTLWIQIAHSLASGSIYEEIIHSRLQIVSRQKDKHAVIVQAGPPAGGPQDAAEQWKRDCQRARELEHEAALLEREASLLTDSLDALQRLVEWKSELITGNSVDGCPGWSPLCNLIREARGYSFPGPGEAVAPYGHAGAVRHATDRSAIQSDEPPEKRCFASYNGPRGRASHALNAGRSTHRPPVQNARQYSPWQGGCDITPDVLCNASLPHQQVHFVGGPSAICPPEFPTILSFFHSIGEYAAQLRAGGPAYARLALEDLGLPLPRSGSISYQAMSHPCEPLLGEYRLASLALEDGEDPRQVLCRSGWGDEKIQRIYEVIRRRVGSSKSETEF